MPTADMINEKSITLKIIKDGSVLNSIFYH